MPKPAIVSIDVGSLAGSPVAFNASGRATRFTDNVSAITNVVIRHFRSDDVIELTGVCRDSYNFSTSFDDPRDLVITYNFSGGTNFTSIVLDNVLTGGFVFDYDSAVAAVGHDFLVSTSVEVSIDVGTVLSAVNLDAAGSNFCFEDNATATTNVVLQNVTAGDQIMVSGAVASDYNFARSFDDINDLVITYVDTVSGATNQIVIDDVLLDTGSVSNYASAVSTVGFDFMTFA